MQILYRMFLMTLLVSWATAGLKAAQPENRWVGAVKESITQIFSNTANPGEVQKGLARLLETVDEITARDTQLPVEFRKHLQMAAKAFAVTPFSPEHQTALQQAYPLINEGADFVFPSNVHDIETASRVARQRIDESVKALENGQYRQGMRDILAFILMVTTPMVR